MHVTVTASPTAVWIWQQVREATSGGRQPRYLLRDRDAVYGGDFVQRHCQVDGPMTAAAICGMLAA